MPYTKTDWSTAKITADNFNKLQTQYAQAVADAIGIRANGTAELRAEVVNDFPAHAIGRIIYHQGYKMFFYSNGIEWLLDPKEAYWGDAQNGIFSSAGDVTFTHSPGATIIKNYRKFTLNVGHTLTTDFDDRPFRCLVIRSWDDIVINGKIYLTFRGGCGDRYITIGGAQYDLLGGLGGDGGKGGHDTGGAGGSDSGERYAGGLRGGGGGGGGGNDGGVGGNGGASNSSHTSTRTGGFGGSVSGGSSSGGDGQRGGGGGGGAREVGATATAIGGRGGIENLPNNSSSGGGGGCVMYSFTGTGRGNNGAWRNGCGGAALVLLSMKNIIINGEIESGGVGASSGGDAKGFVVGSRGFVRGGGGGGGASGGGKVVAIHRGNYLNAGTVNLSGGTVESEGGLGWTDNGGPTPNFGLKGENGQPGQDGTISTYQL